MNEILNYTLFTLGNYTLQTSEIILLSLFIIGIIIYLKVLKWSVDRLKNIDPAKKYSIYNLIKYFSIVIAAVIGFQIAGFNLSVLLAGSAALLVGLGLGLQNLFSDYISGIVLLIDASIKVGDIIEVNGLVCDVKEINLRTTTVLTRDGKYIILPNTDLTKNPLINWTHSKVTSRFEVSVGVDYTSNVSKVMELLKQSAVEQRGILNNPEPFVRFTEFADSSINFSIIFWADEVFTVENIKSELRIKIFQHFNDNQISIPFPQRVMHTTTCI